MLSKYQTTVLLYAYMYVNARMYVWKMITIEKKTDNQMVIIEYI